MDFDPHNLIYADNLDGIFSDEMNYYITHAYCTAGRCELDYSGDTIVLEKGNVMILMANREVSAIRPSEDFAVKVIFIGLNFMAACTPHTSYGIRGGGGYTLGAAQNDKRIKAVAGIRNWANRPSR